MGRLATIFYGEIEDFKKVSLRMILFGKFQGRLM